jgi:hypothetical protein
MINFSLTVLALTLLAGNREDYTDVLMLAHEVATET